MASMSSPPSPLQQHHYGGGWGNWGKLRHGGGGLCVAVGRSAPTQGVKEGAEGNPLHKQRSGQPHIPQAGPSLSVMGLGDSLPISGCWGAHPTAQPQWEHSEIEAFGAARLPNLTGAAPGWVQPWGQGGTEIAGVKK